MGYFIKILSLIFETLSKKIATRCTVLVEQHHDLVGLVCVDKQKTHLVEETWEVSSKLIENIHEWSEMNSPISVLRS
jgi:hypothetical protein